MARENLAETIGQAVIATIADSGLTRVSFAVDDKTGVEIEAPTTVTVWSANAAEQIGQMIIDRFVTA
jgi:hypothetical protein